MKRDDATYGKMLRLCCENDIQSIAQAICIMLGSRYGKYYVDQELAIPELRTHRACLSYTYNHNYMQHDDYCGGIGVGLAN